MKSTEDRFWEKVEVRGPEDCWEWTAYKNRKGYGYFSIAGAGVTGAHRVSWEFANGSIPPGLYVLHSCDRPSCVNPAHLRTGTQTDNMRDMIGRGRSWQPKGVTNSKAKLSESDVLDIRRRCAGGEKRVPVAKLYGVTRSTVSRIVSLKTWAHI